MTRPAPTSVSPKPYAGVIAVMVAEATAAGLHVMSHAQGADGMMFAGDVVELIPKGGQAMRDAVRQVWIGGRPVPLGSTDAT